MELYIYIYFFFQSVCRIHNSASYYAEFLKTCNGVFPFFFSCIFSVFFVFNSVFFLCLNWRKESLLKTIIFFFFTTFLFLGNPRYNFKNKTFFFFFFLYLACFGFKSCFKYSTILQCTIFGEGKIQYFFFSLDTLTALLFRLTAVSYVQRMEIFFSLLIR